MPVYNVEGFLDQCIESIVAQSYPHLEILVVDDGSTDGSGDKCDRWAERDRRIRVTHQPNGGLSAARNTALDIMGGQWVIMVDSDDVLHPDAVSTLLHAAQGHHADIAVGNYVTMGEHDAPRWPHQAARPDQADTFTQQEALLAVFYQRGLTHSAWGRIYRAALFDGIRYPVGQLYEDLAIIYPLLKKCTRVVKTSQVVYGYRQRHNSILYTFSPKRADVLTICEGLEASTLQHDRQYTRAVRSRLLSAYFNILLLSSQDVNGGHDDLRQRCWNGIKRLRRQCILDPKVRLKNKLGILASLPGRRFLCSVIGRHYQPQP